MRIACIGTRGLTPEQIVIAEEVGRVLALAGHIIRTGNAPGADQAYARGANEVNTALVELELPWPRFERQAIMPGNVTKSLEDHSAAALAVFEGHAQKYHPRYSFLTQGARKLMARNSAIMFREAQSQVWNLQLVPVDLCLAWPGKKPGGGGTGQGMRIAQGEGIKLVDLSQLSLSGIDALVRHLQTR